MRGDPPRVRGGARGCVMISQISATQRTTCTWRSTAQAQSVLEDRRSPNSLWIGRRARANGVLPKDPRLLKPVARPLRPLSGGNGEAYPDGSRTCSPTSSRAFASGRSPATTRRTNPTFRAGHRAAILVEAVLSSHRTRSWVEIPVS